MTSKSRTLLGQAPLAVALGGHRLRRRPPSRPHFTLRIARLPFHVVARRQHPLPLGRPLMLPRHRASLAIPVTLLALSLFAARFADPSLTRRPLIGGVYAPCAEARRKVRLV